jgi:hypothetical protein
MAFFTFWRRSWILAAWLGGPLSAAWAQTESDVAYECCTTLDSSQDSSACGRARCRGLLGAPTLFSWGGMEPDDEPRDPWSEPLTTDRPDFTEASITVGRGVRQLEMGFTYAEDDEDGSEVQGYSYPETLLRAGIFADWLEFRVGWNYLEERVSDASSTATFSGSDDLYLGLKLGLTSQSGFLPEMALVPQMTVPLGSVFTADEVLPGVNWLYGWDVNDWLSTAGSTQFNRAIDGESGEPYIEFAQSWTIGYSFTESWGAYTEWFCFVPDGADTARTEHYMDGGFTFLVSDDLQLDWRAGVGLSEAAADYFLGTGLSARF